MDRNVKNHCLKTVESEDLNHGAKQIQDKVGCAYLHLSFGGVLSNSRRVALLIECRHNVCGPRHGCNFYEYGKCDYKSDTINPDMLYDPQPLTGE